MKLLDYHALREKEKASWNFADVERDAAFVEHSQALLAVGSERVKPGLLTLDGGPLFQKVQQLCQFYRDASPAQRTYLRSQVDFRLGGRLASFGLRAAVAGARERAPDGVALGVTAFVLADLVGDVREVLMSLSVMLRCAKLSGADAAQLFHEVAAIAGPAMSAVLVDFSCRPPEVSTLASMGWREVETPEGVGFVFGAKAAPKSV